MGSDPHSLMFLGVSVAALLVGPGIHRIAEREPVTMAALDNFVLVTIVGLVALEIVPGALQLAGLPALLALIIGVLGPALADGPLHRASRGTHRTAMVLAVLGMAIHSFTDGLALASAHVAGGRSHALEVAVIAHQLPVAVAVWWLLSPAGLLRACAAMLLLGLATILGFLLADRSLEALAPAWLGLLQGLFAGLLLHVVAHRTHTADAELRSRIAASLGGLAGLGLLALLVFDAGHGHDADPLAQVLLAAGAIARASAPALLLGLLLLGLLAAWPPAPRDLTRGGPLLRAARGVLLGLRRPLRTNDLLPVVGALTARGAPASVSLGFLVAAPTLGIDALLLSMPLLGGGMTLARGLGAIVLALIVGVVVGGRADRHGNPSEHDDPTEPIEAITPRPGSTPIGRLLAALDTAIPWLALGLLVAAMLAPWLRPATFAAIPPWVQIPLMAAIGVPAHLCAAAVTPVIAVLLAAGLSPGAGLAFLLTGPALGVATQGLLARLHGPRIAALNLGLVFVVAVALGFTLDYVLNEALDYTAFTAMPQVDLVHAMHDVHAMHEVGNEAETWVEAGLEPGAAGVEHGVETPGFASDLALAALIALALASLLRQTPQQFLRRLWVRDDVDDKDGKDDKDDADDADDADDDRHQGHHHDHGHAHHHHHDLPGQQRHQDRPGDDSRWHTRRAHISSRGPRAP